jgi:hypothetical protein
MSKPPEPAGPPARSAMIGFMATPEVRTLVATAAKADDRTMSAWVYRLVQRELRRRGLMPKDDQP